MGTDIHMAAEVRKNGKWQLVTECVFPHYNFCYNQDKGRKRSISDRKTFHPYNGCNYNLFAMLADVRNGIGFAGCVTGEHINPISEPKGYPEDMCDGWGDTYIYNAMRALRGGNRPRQEIGRLLLHRRRIGNQPLENALRRVYNLGTNSK